METAKIAKGLSEAQVRMLTEAERCRIGGFRKPRRSPRFHFTAWALQRKGLVVLIDPSPGGYGGNVQGVRITLKGIEVLTERLARPSEPL